MISYSPEFLAALIKSAPPRSAVWGPISEEEAQEWRDYFYTWSAEPPMADGGLTDEQVATADVVSAALET